MITTHGTLDLNPVRSTTRVLFVEKLPLKNLRNFLAETAAILEMDNYPQCLSSFLKWKAAVQTRRRLSLTWFPDFLHLCRPPENEVGKISKKVGERRK